MSAEEVNNLDLSYENEAIEGTPFRYIRQQERGMIVFGTYAIENNLNNINEAKEYLQKESYNVITKMIIIMEELNNLKKTN